MFFAREQRDGRGGGRRRRRRRTARSRVGVEGARADEAVGAGGGVAVLPVSRRALGAYDRCGDDRRVEQVRETESHRYYGKSTPLFGRRLVT